MAKRMRNFRKLMRNFQLGVSTSMADVDIYEEEEEKHFKQIYKILIIGDSNVGKTALLTRYVEGRFQSAFMSTVGESIRTLVCVILLSKSCNV